MKVQAGPNVASICMLYCCIEVNNKPFLVIKYCLSLGVGQLPLDISKLTAYGGVLPRLYLLPKCHQCIQ